MKFATSLFSGKDWMTFPFTYFSVCLLFSIVFTLTSTEFVADDIVFSQLPMSFPYFVVFRYFEWSSRTIIDALIFFFCKTFPYPFYILNIIVLTSGPIFVWFLFKDFIKKEFYWVIFILYMFCSINIESGAITTPLNYLWPLCFMLFSFCAIKVLLENRHINKYISAILYLFTIFAANQEQICATLFLVSFGALIFSKIKTGAFNKKIAIIFSLCAISLIFIVTTPGNAVRYHQEVARWFPDFISLSFFYKVYLGFVTTLRHYFFHINFSYLAFAGILGLCLCAKYGLSFRDAGTLTVFAPFIAPLLLSPFVLAFGDSQAIIPRAFGDSGYLVDAFNYRQVQPYVTLFVSVFFCFFILRLLFLLLEKKSLCILIAILAIGAASRIIIGFSPTLFASGTRTFMLMDFSWIFAALMLMCKSPDLSQKTLRILLFPCFIMQLLFHIL